MDNKTPYQHLGSDGIRRLADEFYNAMDELPQAETIRAMHAKNLDEIKLKLYEYLSGWMGGPPLYSEKTGTVCLTEPHEPYWIGPDERDQWLLCMDKALERIDASDEVREMLKTPMYRIADTVRNREESAPRTTDPDVIAVG